MAYFDELDEEHVFQEETQTPNALSNTRNDIRKVMAGFLGV
jgi:hypothetical protein